MDHWRAAEDERRTPVVAGRSAPGVPSCYVSGGDLSKPLLVIYATREGHTRRIAEHVGSTLEAQGRPLELVDAAHLPSDFAVANYAGAIVAASLHAGKHQAEIVRLVKHHVGELQQLPTLFVSASLTEVTVEDPAADPEKRAQAAADVKRTIDEFLTDTGWHPSHVAGVAGHSLTRSTTSSFGT